MGGVRVVVTRNEMPADPDDSRLGAADPTEHGPPAPITRKGSIMMTTARTQDAVEPTHTADGRRILYTLEPGAYAFTELDDGRVAIVPARASDTAGPPTYEQIMEKNRIWLAKMKAAAGAWRAQ